ncbi:Aminopeptidase Ey [Hypsibius exemplaris]|uniref:Aminopeptidase Ey n=1 Tax=Hypsibius exemplaris TaxID=2072580 RepID=A0A1W0WL87_HYPEX|nr:Aminopeptidase Ey [Hypsibius exemplaris]
MSRPVVDYDALTEMDDPDVAFLAGSDDLEIRSAAGERTKSASSSAVGRSALRRRSPSWCSSAWLWIFLLCLLVGCLVITLGVILYRRSYDKAMRVVFSDGLENSSAVLMVWKKEDFASLTTTMTMTSWEDLVDKTTAAPKPALVEKCAGLTACYSQRKRLPDTVHPHIYHLNLTVPNVTHGAYSGSVKIDFSVSDTVMLIVVHAKNLTIDISKIRLGTKSESGIDGWILPSSICECHSLDQLQISTRHTLQPGTAYQLEIVFSGVLSNGAAGFYRSSYLDENNKKIFLATTQFEASDARAAFPCFDEPALKAIFRVRLTHHPSMTALSNAPVKTSVFNQGHGSQTTEFEDTPIMSTYLVAFILCDFVKKTQKTKSGVEVNVYAVKHKLGQIDFALDTAVKVLKFYEDFFGIKYPLMKLDLIGIPDFSAGAMENWGLITFRESMMLYDPVESPLNQMDQIAITVAHEIAHQWFGNLVTMSWWDQLWLNEGFATFMSYLGAEAAQPQLSLWQRISIDTVQVALPLDALSNTHAIVLDVEDTSDIASRFDTISYYKGASILLMVYRFLGPSVFRAGVSTYLSKHQYGTATTEDLWSALDAAWPPGNVHGAKTVKDIADSWILQPGFPKVQAFQRPNARQVDIIQSKMVSMSHLDGYGPTWMVPISMVDSGGSVGAGTVASGWLDGQTTGLNLSSAEVKWFKLNANQSSFYRTNYEKANWDALTTALKANISSFSPEDRANLLDDAFSLSRAGKLSMTTVLNLASYLTRETHYLPWHSALPYLHGTENLLFNTEAFMSYRRWRRSLIEPVFKTTDCFHAIPSDISKRRFCINTFDEACNADLPECIAKAQKMFEDAEKNITRIPPDFHDAIYRTVVKHGDEVVWDRLWHRYQTTQVASEKHILLLSLSATKNMWLIERYLRYAFNPEMIRPTDTVTVLMSLSLNNYAARESVWRTIRRQWDVIVERYGSDSTISGVIRCLDWMTSEADLEEVRTFFRQPGRKLGAGALALNQTLETIDLRRQFLKLYSNQTGIWLASQNH